MPCRPLVQGYCVFLIARDCHARLAFFVFVTGAIASRGASPLCRNLDPGQDQTYLQEQLAQDGSREL